MKKNIYMFLGFTSLVLAYIGIIIPGFPTTIFLIISVSFFSKSSKKFESWLYNHKWFGNFLMQWKEKNIFPTKAKMSMVIMLILSLIATYFITHNIRILLYISLSMGIVLIYVWRYPGSIEEYNKRINLGQRLFWRKQKKD